MKKAWIMLILSAIIINALLIISNTQAQPGTEVGTTLHPSTAPVGTTFNINVTITNVLNLYVWEFNITFDPWVLNVTAVAEGPFLQNVGGTWWLDPSIDNTNGWVGAGDALFPYPEFGADGNGILAYITFQVKAEGRSDLHFASTQLRSWNSGSGELVNIDHTTKDGFFQIPMGDINNDGEVNALDLAALGRAYCSVPGQPTWNRYADLNKNNVTNSDDLTILDANYGET